jgi:uncharacterized protein (DUF433 family)
VSQGPKSRMGLGEQPSLDRIVPNPEVRSGKPIIRGTRISAADMLEYLAGGMSDEEILPDFPDLVEDEIQAVLAFAAERERRLFSRS